MLLSCFFFFFLMIGRPPSSPLFPYPPLSRPPARGGGARAPSGRPRTGGGGSVPGPRSRCSARPTRTKPRARAPALLPPVAYRPRVLRVWPEGLGRRPPRKRRFAPTWVTGGPSVRAVSRPWAASRWAHYRAGGQALFLAV